MVINELIIKELLEKASTNERKRINYDLRNNDSDTSQRMLNALMPETIVDIHRHTKTSETIIVLHGEVTEIFYDENGKEIVRYTLSPNSGNIGLQIPKGQWHSIVANEPSVIIEMKDGKYIPLGEEDILKVKM
ncbi:WbuC family cupin fold metalloprotein [Prevotella disiens]|jgi:hypothetical protein|uniref:Cupin fold metalloprotein WbuC cupin domain-containing protein n=1 Tax=Prevotella disiens DNF00882 TaxID=1401075 RepID=A0A096ARB5_9BACT|nr:WbuC family cupin fold metalloprotein [Prevotella disiens]KGF49246.1 hypothetical protein HMPREF0654_06160 [Prevotella disiens DNF00882]